MSNITLWEKTESLAEIKKIYGSNLSETDFTIFLNIGKSLDLNPFLREIWAVPYGGRTNIFVGRDGYRKNAQKHPLYDSHIVDSVYSKDRFNVEKYEVSHTYNLEDRGILKGAYCAVFKKGAKHAIYSFVEFTEYSTGQSLWKSKPATMIKKVAEAQTLRMAFQELFAGTYDESEDFTTEEKSYAPKNKEEAKKIIDINPEEDFKKHIIDLIRQEADLRNIDRKKERVNLFKIVDIILKLDNNKFSYNDLDHVPTIKEKFDILFKKETHENLGQS